MTRKTAKEVNKPAGVASADLEENGVPVSEKGAENFSAASSKQRGEMAAPADTNAKPTSAAGRATNGASVSNEVVDSRDSRLDRLEHSLDKVIAFLSEGHVDDENDPSDRAGEGQDGDCQDGVASADPPREGADAMEDGELAEPPPKKPKQSTLFADIARDLKLEESPAPSLSEDLAMMVRKCAREKPSEEAVKLLQDKAAEYGVPGNCTELAVPRRPGLGSAGHANTDKGRGSARATTTSTTGLDGSCPSDGRYLGKRWRAPFWIWSLYTLRRYQIYRSYECGSLH